jgi:hypothetical protein
MANPKYWSESHNYHVKAYNGRFTIVFAFSEANAKESLTSGEAYLGTLKQVKRKYPCIYKELKERELTR